jgi:hypothetical protein
MTRQSRARSAVASAVLGLPSRTLGEVTEQVALNARAERKYMVPADRFAQLIARLPQRYRSWRSTGSVDSRTSRCTSTLLTC